jgi:DHA1 family tetracycline resistance protein-like MFS transporter
MPDDAPVPPDSTPVPAPGRAAFAFIFVTVCLDMLALGVMVPVLPKLIVAFEGGDMAKAARVTGAFGFIWAAMQFVASPMLGALSDRHGRRGVILLSNLGLGLDYIVMALAPSLGWLFVGRVLSGITAASFPTASAYIADVTPPEKRAERFGMLGAAFGLGFIIGPAVGGSLGAIDLRLPFWVSAGLSLANAAYGVFILPESLPPERRSRVGWKVANPLGALALLSESPRMMGMAAVACLDFLAHESLPSVFVLYAGYRYHWTERTVGLSLAAIGLSSAVVSAGMVGPVVKRLGERASLVVGLGFGALGFGLYGVAPTDALFWAGIPFIALLSLSGSALGALMSRDIPAHAQGQLQGALSSLRGITGMIGPIVFTQLFAYVVRPGADPSASGGPFLLAAALLGVSLAIAVGVTRAAAAPTQSGAL